MNSIKSNILQDGSRNFVITTLGVLDTSDYPVTNITDIAILKPIPTQLRLDKIFYSIEDGLSCLLWWEAAPDILLMPISGRGMFDFEWFAGHSSPKNVGATGNIRLSTQGYISGVKHFTLVLDFVKQGI